MKNWIKLLFMFFPFCVGAQVYTVTNTNDVGNGSLRVGIEQANLGLYDEINFNISPNSNDVDTIKLLSALPPIGKVGLKIDGTTESGYKENEPILFVKNNYANRSDAAFDIRVDSISIVGIGISGFRIGAFLGASNTISMRGCRLSNLLIHDCEFGINSSPSASSINRNGLLVENCIIGDPFDTLGILGNNFGVIISVSDSNKVINNKIYGCNSYGISLSIVSNSIIESNFVQKSGIGGGFTFLETSIIRDNSFIANLNYGIELYGENNFIDNNEIGGCNTGLQVLGGKNIVVNNYIGVYKTGEIAPNFFAMNLGDSSNVIGLPNQGNVFANSTSRGVSISGGKNKIMYNKFYSNTGRGLIIGSANNSKAKPTILSHSINGNELTLIGASSPFDTIQVSINDGLEDHVFDFIGNAIADINGDWSLVIPRPFYNQTKNNFYIANATDSLGNSSEFSLPYRVGGVIGICTVTNTNDTGLGSLRGCVEWANTVPGRDSIIFEIPDSLANNEGKYEIELQARLEISDGLILDGSNQSDFNNSPIIVVKNEGLTLNGFATNSAIRSIGFEEIQGSLAYVLWVDSDTVEVVNNYFINCINRGAIIFNFGGNGLIKNNMIGTNHYGDTSSLLSGGVFISRFATGKYIVENNLITKVSSLGIGAILISHKTDFIIQNNEIFSNQSDGIYLNSTMFGIGDTSYIIGNYIFGNEGRGITDFVAVSNRDGSVLYFHANKIGVNKSGDFVSNGDFSQFSYQTILGDVQDSLRNIFYSDSVMVLGRQFFDVNISPFKRTSFYNNVVLSNKYGERLGDFFSEGVDTSGISFSSFSNHQLEGEIDSTYGWTINDDIQLYFSDSLKNIRKYLGSTVVTSDLTWSFKIQDVSEDEYWKGYEVEDTVYFLAVATQQEGSNGVYVRGSSGLSKLFSKYVTICDLTAPNLLEDIELCKGAKMPFSSTYHGDNYKYTWFTQMGDTLSNKDTLWVEESGVYVMQIQHTPACTYYDTLEVVYNNVEFEANFLLASETYKDEETLLLNVSPSYVDTLAWSFDGADVVAYDNEDYLISYPEVGVYSVSLTAQHDDCYGVISREVNVLENPFRPGEKEAYKFETIVQELELYPNPNNGQFVTYVKLNKEEQVTLKVMNLSGVVLNEQVGLVQKVGSSFDFYLGNLESGLYLLELQAGGDTQVLKFVKH